MRSVITFKHKGNFDKTSAFLTAVGKGSYLKGLEEYGELGVQLLKQYTPRRTGKTAESWSYSIEKTKTGISINWNNSNLNKGVNVAMLIQYGHAMPQGYYVEGIDYINPALKPLFDTLGKQLWEEVTKDAKH